MNLKLVKTIVSSKKPPLTIFTKMISHKIFFLLVISVSLVGILSEFQNQAFATQYAVTDSATTLTLNAISPSSISWGASVTVSGKLTSSSGVGLGGKTVTFSGTGATNLLSVVTSSDGTFTIRGASPSSVLSGWTVQSHFAGDSQYIGADSPVNAYNTLIHKTVFWSLNVPTSKTHGTTYTADGKLKDSTTGLFLPSKTVTFTATSPIVIQNAVTDSTGKYSVSGLVAPAAGSYNIQAKFAGDSLYTSSSSLTKVLKVPTTLTTTTPQPPTGLAATVSSSSQVNLSWNTPSNNGGSVITGYKIERSADGGTTWSLVSSTGPATTYSDTGLSGTTYTYRVSAINIIGTSSQSNTASTTTQTSKGFLINIFAPRPTPALTSIVNSHLNQNDFVSSYRTVNMMIYPKPSKSLYTSSIPMTVNQIAVAKQNGLEYICYDNEKDNAGLSSPTSELVQPAYYTNTVGKMVKDAGLKYNIQPEWESLEQEYKDVNWGQVDLLTMQLQRFPLGITPEQHFKDLAIAVSTLARSENPNITILAQVNLGFDTSPNNQAALDFVNSLKGHIDGVSIVMADSTTTGPFLTALGR